MIINGSWIVVLLSYMSCQGSFRSLPKSVKVFFDLVCLQIKSQSALTFPASWHSNENPLPKMCAIQFVSPFSGSRCPSPALESPWVPGHEKSPNKDPKVAAEKWAKFSLQKMSPNWTGGFPSRHFLWKLCFVCRLCFFSVQCSNRTHGTWHLMDFCFGKFRSRWLTPAHP